MPRDAEIGRELASAISAADTGRIKAAKFKYDAYIEAEELPKDVQVFITPATYVRKRLARAVWTNDCSLTIMLMVDCDVTKDNADATIDRWLNDWDNMQKAIENLPILGHLPVSMEQDDRYDRERLVMGKRLVCLCEIVYKLI